MTITDRMEINIIGLRIWSRKDIVFIGGDVVAGVEGAVVGMAGDTVTVTVSDDTCLPSNPVAIKIKSVVLSRTTVCVPEAPVMGPTMGISRLSAP